MKLSQFGKILVSMQQRSFQQDESVYAKKLREIRNAVKQTDQQIRGKENQKESEGSKYS